MLTDASEYTRMARAETRLWWYRALHYLVLKALAAHPKRADARILDAGCGTGGLIQFLAGQGYRRITGFDVSPFAVEICRQRGLNVCQGDLRDFNDNNPERLDIIVSNDTLYFFDSTTREQIVRSFWQILAPGSLLILNLPALRCFRGSHDQAVGITRRFSREDAALLLAPLGFEIIETRFWPFLLSPAIYATRFAQRLRLAISGKGGAPQSDTRVPSHWLNELFARITRFEINRLASPPFGSSLFVVARKPEG